MTTLHGKFISFEGSEGSGKSTHIERLERQLRTEVQNVHRQYRRDLVIYREERLPERQ